VIVCISWVCTAITVVALPVLALGQLLPRAWVPAQAQAPAPDLPWCRLRVHALLGHLGLLELLGLHGVPLTARDLHGARVLSLRLG
jgi:hypothetical protein